MKRQDVLDAEMHICETLEFRLHRTTPLCYFDRFLHASVVGDGHMWPSRPNRTLVSLVSYLNDVSLLSEKIAIFHPQQVAASAIYLARCTLGIVDPFGLLWTDTLAHYTGYRVWDLSKYY